MKNRLTSYALVEYIIPIVLIVFAGFIYWQAGLLKTQASEVLGASFFPKVLAIALAVCSIAALVWMVLSNSSLNESSDHNSKTSIVVIAALIVYAAAMPYITFVAATILFLLFMLWLLGEKRIVIFAVIPVSVTLVVYVIFQMFLRVQLP